MTHWVRTATANFTSIALIIVGVVGVGAAQPAPAAAAPVPAPGGSWVGLTPVAVFNGSVGAGGTHTVTVAGVPAGATAWLTVSESGATRAGAVSVYTHATAPPQVPTLAFVAGQAASNQAAVATTSTAGQVDVNNTSTATVTMRVDVSGYYVRGAPAAAAMFGLVSGYPAANAVSVASGQSVNVTVAGVGGVPSTATVVAAQVSVAAPAGSGGLTAYPVGGAKPDTQSLLFTCGRPAATLNIVKVGTSGRVTLLNTASVTVKVSLLIEGYYTAGSPKVARAFSKPAPAHLFDTSTGLGVPKAPVAANTALTGTATGAAGVPGNGVTAVVLLLSASAATATGYLTAYPSGSARPSTPYVEFSTGRSSSGLVVVPVSSTGRISLYNASPGTVQLRADIVGYYNTASALSWSTPQLLDHEPGVLEAVSCPTTTFCMAMDHEGYTLQFNGTTWTISAEVLFPVEYGATISCGASTLCVARDGYTNALYRWDGNTWTGPSYGTNESPQVVSCATATFCMVVGRGGWLTWNGTSWSGLHDWPTMNTPRDVSCVTASFCVALDENSAYSYDGHVWGPAATINPNDGSGRVLMTISCASTTFCVATDHVNTVARSHVFRNGTWGTATAVPLAANYPIRLSCRASTCMTAYTDPATSAPIVRTFNGTTWSAPVTLSATPHEPALSCGSSTFCVAAFGNSIRPYNGSQWAPAAAVDPDQGVPLEHVSCASSTFCVATDRRNAMTWNGASWSSKTQLGGTVHPTEYYSSYVSDVSCVRWTFCIALLSAGFIAGSPLAGWALWNGTKWTIHDHTIGTSTGLKSISCVSTTFCLAVGSAPDDSSVSEAWRFNGSTWTMTTQWSHPLYVTSVSCASAMSCVAMGWRYLDPFTSSGQSFSYAGGVWSSAVPTNEAKAATGVSCQAPTLCMSVDYQGQEQTFNGTQWSAPIATSSSAGFAYGISCVQPATCIVVGTGNVGGVGIGYEAQYLGFGAWRTLTPLTAGIPVSISCPATNFCMTVTNAGFVITGRAA